MLFQLIGSALVLGAFCAAALGRARPDSVPYLLANVVGATLLAVDAFYLRQWGFLALEATWAIVSAWSLGQWSLSRSSRPRP